MKKIVQPCGRCLVFNGMVMPSKQLAEDEPITLEPCPTCGGEGRLEYEIGTEEGEVCNRMQPESIGGGHCTGIISEHEKETCSCHMNPPCSSCVEDRRYCPECDWEGADEQDEK